MGIIDSCRLANQVYWVLCFTENLSQICIDDDTACCVEGLVVSGEPCGKSRPGESTTVENRGCAPRVGQHRGISCTLRQLRRGEVDAALTVTARGDGETRVYCKLKLVDINFSLLQTWLDRQQQEVALGDRPDSNIVFLGQYVQSLQSDDSRQLKYKAALAAARGVGLDDIPLSHVDRAIAMELTTRSSLLPRGCRVVVSLVDGRGTIVSEQVI